MKPQRRTDTNSTQPTHPFDIEQFLTPDEANSSLKPQNGEFGMQVEFIVKTGQKLGQLSGQVKGNQVDQCIFARRSLVHTSIAERGSKAFSVIL